MVEQAKPFQPLRISRLAPQTGYARPHFHIQNPVKASSSALEVMTDLCFIPAATVCADLDLDSATHQMIGRGVRSLLVTDAHGDVIGIITARDLLGERPQGAMHERGVPFGEVLVRDVMTANDDIEVLQLEDVLHARVGDVVATLKHSGRQHALVVEVDCSTGKNTIRGIFSASQIARQLGVHAQPQALSDTFAGIEQAMYASR